MKARVLAMLALGLCIAAQVSGAQAPCSTSAALADSARADLAAVMTSGSPLVADLRKEQGLSATDDGAQATIVKERYVCAKVAAAFDHIVAPGVTFPVLKMGNVYYARDPNQRVATGVITDSTFKVIMRLGKAVNEKAK